MSTQTQPPAPCKQVHKSITNSQQNRAKIARHRNPRTRQSPNLPCLGSRRGVVLLLVEFSPRPEAFDNCIKPEAMRGRPVPIDDQLRA